MAEDDEDKGVNVQSGEAMGFSGGGASAGVSPEINVGGAMDAVGGLGGGLGLTGDVGPAMDAQVAMGPGGPGLGSWSRTGATAGGLLGGLLGIGPIGTVIGGFGPGAINAMRGGGAAPQTAAAFGGGGGGMLGGGLAGMLGGLNTGASSGKEGSGLLGVIEGPGGIIVPVMAPKPDDKTKDRNA